jgi:hypothetical protein
VSEAAIFLIPNEAAICAADVNPVSTELLINVNMGLQAAVCFDKGFPPPCI